MRISDKVNDWWFSIGKTSIKLKQTIFLFYSLSIGCTNKFPKFFCQKLENYHLIKFDTDCLKKTIFLCILIQIFIIAFKIGFFCANTSMPTVNQIFHTLLIGLGRYGLLFLQWISFSDLNRPMARSPERIFEFWKQEKVTGSQIWRIQWLRNDFCFVFSQKFSHNQGGMWRRIIVVKNP